MEYNARVCNHKYIQHDTICSHPWMAIIRSAFAVCTCGYARVHYTPDCPAWGVLTGLYPTSL